MYTESIASKDSKINKVISEDTIHEMYMYLAKEGEIDFKAIKYDSQKTIERLIKSLASMLYLKGQLFIKKRQQRLEMNEPDLFTTALFKPVCNINYSCKSNGIIFETLKKIGDINKYLPEDDYDNIENISKARMQIESIYNNSGDFENDINRLDNGGLKEIITGSNIRKSLIKLCAIYWNHKELVGSKENFTDEHIEREIEAQLAEQVLRVYTNNKIDGIHEARSMRFNRTQVNKNCAFCQDLNTDLNLFWSNGNRKYTYVIDVKVYKDIIIQRYHDNDAFNKGYRYISNANRYQVNAYIGSCIAKKNSKSSRFYKRECLGGALIHFANKDMIDWMNSLNILDYNGTDLSIEPDRPIELFVIVDRGLKSIFEQYDDYIKKKFNIQEELQF